MTTPRAAHDRLAPLIGRAELVEDIASERVVLLVAQPGAGKSRILAELKSIAPEAVAVTVRCHRGVVSTYEPLEALVDAAARHLKAGARVPAPRTPVDDADRLVVLRERFEAIAGIVPLLVQIDDLHWAPQATLDAIAFCIDRTRDSAIRWQLATRPVADGPDPLEAFRREPDCTIVDLPMLDAAETVEFARALGHDAPAGLHKLTGGNPLYVEQWLLARTRPGRASTLRATLEARVGEIPERAMETAAIVAVAERPLTIGELAQTLERDDDVRTTVDDLQTLGILRNDGDSVEFVHDLLRGACVSAIDETRRAHIHAALVAVARNDVERAVHLVAANRREEAEVSYLEAARAAIYDYAFAEVREIAARLRALPELTLASQWQLSAIDLIFDNARLGFSNDRTRIGALLAGRTCVDPETSAFYLRHALSVCDSPREGLGPLVIDTMIEAPDLGIPEKAPFYRHRAIALYIDERFDEGIAMIDALLATGDVPAKNAFELRCMRALLRSNGALDEARADLVALAEDPANAGYPSLDFAYLVLGNLEEACDGFEAQIRWAKAGLACRGRIREPFYKFWASANLSLGNLSEALDVCETFLGWSLSRGMTHQPGPLTIHIEAYAWAGRFDRANRTLAESGYAGDPRLAFAQAVLADHEGRMEVAARLYASVSDRAGAESTEYEASALAALVRVHCMNGKLASARIAYDRLCETSLSNASRKERAECDFYLALASGEFDEARRCLESFDDARVAVLRRAAALAYVGERTRDRDALFEATAVFERCGAKLFEERTRHIARGFGFRFGSKSVSRDVLTEREADIARLIAAGRTNREIADTLHVSPKTVATNISTMLERYGLRSRVEIAANIAAGKPFERATAF